jgi:hypothetical protein
MDRGPVSQNRYEASTDSSTGCSVTFDKLIAVTFGMQRGPRIRGLSERGKPFGVGNRWSYRERGRAFTVTSLMPKGPNSP